MPRLPEEYWKRTLLNHLRALEKRQASSEPISNFSFNVNNTSKPTRYVFSYRGIPCFERKDLDSIRRNHQVEITLGRDFPFDGPKARMLTPIFHPNVSRGDMAKICIDPITHWRPTYTLTQIAEAIIPFFYDTFDTRSPLNSVAANWYDRPEVRDRIMKERSKTIIVSPIGRRRPKIKIKPITQSSDEREVETTPGGKRENSS